MVGAEGSEERLIAYCRVGCPHSDRTKETLNNLCSSKFSNIKIIDVENNNASKKEATDEIHKLFENSNDTQKNGVYEYNTFPRIIYISVFFCSIVSTRKSVFFASSMNDLHFAT